ncbi:MAG: glycosyltransferase family 4 protein [Candidatus Thorarchaeota archaeon]|jgi:glycosyltransferase involved in cell wall biosynthesis
MNIYEDQQTVLFVANRSYALTSSRLLLIKHFLSSGWKVIVASSSNDIYAERLRDLGVIIEPVVFDRGGLSLLNDSRAFIKLVVICRKYRPKLIHLFHVKPVVLGNAAAFFVPKSKVVNNIEGLGYAFVHGGFTRFLAEFGYSLALSRSELTIFLNPDDRELFLKEKWVSKNKTTMIISTGIDIEDFSPKPEPGMQRETDETKVIFMATRLLYQKGVKEFIEAAAEINNPQIRFQLAGEWEIDHPDAVEKEVINNAEKKGYIEYVGYVKDMPEKLKEVDIFVLPSYYREGVPRVLLEAAATGIPIVTTNMPGCRETVVDGETGFLIPPQDSSELVKAVLKIIQDRSIERNMGKRARAYIENNFDIKKITKTYLKEYNKIGVDI